MTPNIEVAQRYANGSGKLIRFEVDPNLKLLSAHDSKLSASAMIDFVKSRHLLKKKKEIISDIKAFSARVGRDDIFPAILLNLMVNYDVIRGEHGPALAKFYVDHGIDADIVKLSGREYLVLFNPEKIISHRFVSAKEARP